MKRIGFYAKTNRSGNLLHIETDGCLVNIHVGLTDRDGHQVTSVRISPDDVSRGGDGAGRIWVQDGSRIVRLHEGETALAKPNGDNTALDRIARSLRDRKLHGRYLAEAIEDAVRATGRNVDPVG